MKVHRCLLLFLFVCFCKNFIHTAYCSSGVLGVHEGGVASGVLLGPSICKTRVVMLNNVYLASKTNPSRITCRRSLLSGAVWDFLYFIKFIMFVCTLLTFLSACQIYSYYIQTNIAS